LPWDELSEAETSEGTQKNTENYTFGVSGIGLSEAGSWDVLVEHAWTLKSDMGPSTNWAFIHFAHFSAFFTLVVCTFGVHHEGLDMYKFIRVI
jgi:hypothetical protein